MKKYFPPALSMILVIVFSAALCLVLSCGKRSCVRPWLKAITFFTSDTTGDSVVVITKFDSNSDFKVVRDSISLTVTRPAYGQGFPSVTYDFEPGYHYKIFVYPLGKTYTVKFIKIGSGYIRLSGSGSMSEICTADYSYYLNDSLIYQAQNNGNEVPWTYIVIKY